MRSRNPDAGRWAGVTLAEHVRPGTRKENVADMHARGRTNLPRGADHWIVKRRAAGLSLARAAYRREVCS